MKNFIKIQNKGLITVEDLVLIGSSTKRGDTSKIGQFGSGWKYALAWVLRNDLSIKIFSGVEEIIVDWEMKLHRDTPVKVLHVNGVPTSITSGMGEIDWKGWMALREIVSNAIDEGEEDVKTYFNPEMCGIEGCTTIWLEMSGELADVLRDYHSYFTFERPAIYNGGGVQIFKKETKTDMRIFRKGILCFITDIKTNFDISFDEVTINESRLSDNYSSRRAFKKFLPTLKDYSVFVDLVKSLPAGWLDVSPESIKDLLIELSKKEKVLPNLRVSLNGIAGLTGNEIVIPTEWYTYLSDLGLVSDILETLLGKKVEGGEFYVDSNLEIESKKVSYYLQPLLKQEVVFVTFLNDAEMVIKDKIYLSGSYSGMAISDIGAKILYKCKEFELVKIIESHIAVEA